MIQHNYDKELLMKKKAYYSDYLWYNSKIKHKAWLLVNGTAIEGFSQEEPGADYDKTVYSNSGIFPTFINTHTHIPMTLFRGLADDLPLHVWLNEHIWPMESKWVAPQFVSDATLLAACELIRGGVSYANDMYFHTDIITDVMYNAGLRAMIGAAYTDGGNYEASKLKTYTDYVASTVSRYANDPMVDIAVCPHAPYTVSMDGFKSLVDFAVKHDITLHTHLAETEKEVCDYIEQYGKHPAAAMNDAGAFDCKSIFAHCVHLGDAEVELMGQKKVAVSHCIQSNMKLASGFADIHSLSQAGAVVSIGTDGAASNNDLDMLGEINSVALCAKGLKKDPTVFSADSVLGLATKNAAKAIHRSDLGELKKGVQADFIVLSYDAIHMMPVYNPVSHLVYSAQKNDITDMFVAGKQLMKDRILLTIDEEAVKDKVRYWQRQITSGGKI